MTTRPALYAALLLGLVAQASGDDPSPNAVPHEGFPADHYQPLWSTSPFAVASPEAVAGSPDFSLVGIAQFDGISYANVIDRESNEHFLLTSNQPTHGLTLLSVTRGQGGGDTTAVVARNGESLTLKLEAAPNAPSAPVPVAMNPAMMQPGSLTPQVPMPNQPMPFTRVFPGNGRTLIRPTIHVPPPPPQQH